MRSSSAWYLHSCHNRKVTLTIRLGCFVGWPLNFVKSKSPAGPYRKRWCFDVFFSRIYVGSFSSHICQASRRFFWNIRELPVFDGHPYTIKNPHEGCVVLFQLNELPNACLKPPSFTGRFPLLKRSNLISTAIFDYLHNFAPNILRA